MKYAILITWSESELQMEFGDRWSHLCASWMSLKIVKIAIFPNILNFKVLYFWCKCIFCQIKKFETYAYDEIYETAIFCPWDTFRRYTSHFGCTPLIFEHFWKLQIFEIFDFIRKLTIRPNDLGQTRESVSWLDISIPRLDISPPHAANRRFWFKIRDFLDFRENLHFWVRINKIELHQQNSILLM